MLKPVKRPGQKAGDKHQCLGNVHAQLFLKSFQGRSRKGTTFLEPLSHLGVTGTSVSALLTELLQTNKLEPPMMLKTVVHFWDPPWNVFSELVALVASTWAIGRPLIPKRVWRKFMEKHAPWQSAGCCTTNRNSGKQASVDSFNSPGLLRFATVMSALPLLPWASVTAEQLL